MQLADVRGQNDISAVAFSADDSLLVADRVNRVTRYQPGSWEQVQIICPRAHASGNRLLLRRRAHLHGVPETG